MQDSCLASMPSHAFGGIDLKGVEIPHEEFAIIARAPKRAVLKRNPPWKQKIVFLTLVQMFLDI